MIGDFLVGAGAVVAGGAAFGAVLGFMIGGLVNDFRRLRRLSPIGSLAFWVETGAGLGGIFGLSVLVWEGVP